MYEKSYEFRFCRLNEIERVEKFIDEYWQKNHIFTKSRSLLDWQHLDLQNERYNFVLAIHKETDEIHALIGFIMSGLYDERIDHPIRWGAIWKIREDVGVKGLGIAVKWFFEQNAPASYIGGIGLSNDSKRINQKLGEKTGQLNHFYLLNDQMTEYELVGDYKNLDRARPVSFDRNPVYLTEISENEFRFAGPYTDAIPPFKSLDYYVNRYFRHPVYSYRFTEIRTGEQDRIACLIWRKAEHEGASCIFIVDYIGDGTEMAGCYSEFQKMMSLNDAEYISFYNYGFDENLFYAGGFRNVKDSEVIIPLYFEPFVKKNVVLDYHYYADGGPDCELFFKGDADQDRPNRL